MKHLITLVLCLFSVLLSASTWTPLITVPEAESAEQGAYFGEFIVLGGLSKPDVPTRVWMWTQGEKLHLRIEAEDPLMSEIPMSVTTRDGSVWSDDTIDFFLSPSDGKVYHFIFNALGTQYDELGDDPKWNGDWTVDVKRELYAWNSEVVIDLKELGGKPADGAEWGFQLGRTRTSRNVYRFFCWAPTGTLRFKDRLGVLRFGNVNHPIAMVPNTENAPQPQYVWSEGNAPECKKVETVGYEGEYLSHEFDFVDASGRALYRANWIKRANRVPAILAQSLVALEKSADVSDQALVTDARALMAVNCDDSPTLCGLLEEEANALRHRMEYRLNSKEMARLGKPAEGIVYGIQNSLVRMRPVDVFTGVIGAGIELDSARNEMEAAQVTLFAGEGPLHQVEAKFAKPLISDSGVALPESAVRVRRLGYVKTCVPTYEVDYVGLYPDPLMPATAFDVPSYGNESLWVDVVVPPETAPGIYQGTLLLQARNADATEIPVTLRVRNITIPKQSSIVSAFGAWFWPEERPFVEDEWAVYEDMLEHRVTPYSVARHPKMLEHPYLPIGGSDALEISVDSKATGTLNLVLTPAKGEPRKESRKVTAGKNTLRLENLQALLADGRLFKLEIELEDAPGAELSAAINHADGTALELLPASFNSIVLDREGKRADWPWWEYIAQGEAAVPAVVDWSEFDADMERAIAMGITAHRADFGDPVLWTSLYRNHLAEKGWLKYFYTYLADEPRPEDYPWINQRLEPVKKYGGTDMMNMMTARSFPPELGFVDTWCPEIYSFNPETAAAEQAKNRNVWWYVAFGTRKPYANVWIDSPITETRIWLWQTWKHNLDGILYWSVNWWVWADPWRTGETFKISNGDGNFLYPDASGKPIASFRWEVLRDGFEDYELFCLLEAAQDEIGDRNPELTTRIAALLSVNPEVCISWEEYTHDASKILAERTRLMDCLEDAIAYLGHQPAITKRPRRRPGLTQQEINTNIEKFRASEDARQRKLAE